jgi:hypothetical protein
VEKLKGGLINRSFKVATPRGPVLLQQINTKVFPEPEKVQDNYIQLWQFAEMEFTGLRLPVPIYFDKTSSLMRDERGNFWRAFEYIVDSKSVEIPVRATQAKAVARAFAKFTSSFDEFDADHLAVTIPGFHDLDLRYRQFEAALHTELYERMAKAMPLIKELKKREKYHHFYSVITESGEFPRRVMHHDAKIGNVLFHKTTGRVICPVDLDTVMAGYFFSDIGDMIRSMAASRNENSTEWKKIGIRKVYYNSIVSTYLKVLDNQLTKSEKKYVHSSGLIMIYMQALRFLTDYLDGDEYYRVERPEHNYERAMNQFTLLESLEEFLLEEHHFKI